MNKNMKPAISTIISKTADYFDVEPSFLEVSNSNQTAGNIRSYAIYVASRYGYSNKDIADAFGYQNTYSAERAVRKVATKIKDNAAEIVQTAQNIKLFIEGGEKIAAHDVKKHSLDDIRSAVATHFNISASDLRITNETRQKNSKARVAFALTADQLGYETAQITSALGYSSANQVTGIISINLARMQNRTHGVLQNVQAVRRIMKANAQISSPDVSTPEEPGKN